MGGTLARTAWAGLPAEPHGKSPEAGTFSRFASLPDVDALFRDGEA